VCVELGEELLGHLVDLIAEDVLLLGSVPTSNAGEGSLPRSIEGPRAPVCPQRESGHRLKARQPEVRSSWAQVQASSRTLPREVLVRPVLTET
jgi:hypothetical protein